ncbi:HPP family protein [Planomonospora corallina]|uniref:HPP family protein n=1 Tax=Planomonospora corallina TaxID=1806052 RepID=A0ABV8I4W5_9ACTN
MDVRDLPVARVMSRTLVTVGPDESPLIAWEIMRCAGVHHLPVVDTGGRLRGVLARDELAAAWSGGPAEQSRVRVAELLAEYGCPRVPPDSRLSEAAESMLGASADAVAVVEHGEVLVGMVTATDVVRAVAGLAPDGEGPSEVLTGMFRLVPVLPRHPGE